MFSYTRRESWIQDKIQENWLRRLATRQGLQLKRAPHRDTATPDSAVYKLATVTNNASPRECDLLISTADDMTFEEVENYLMDDATLAEIMDYLTSTYGPGFVEKLIKHLPHSSR